METSRGFCAVFSHLSVFRVMVMVMAGGRDRQPVFQAGNGAVTNRSSKRREDFTRQRHHGLSLSLCFWLPFFSP